MFKMLKNARYHDRNHHPVIKRLFPEQDPRTIIDMKNIEIKTTCSEHYTILRKQIKSAEYFLFFNKNSQFFYILKAKTLSNLFQRAYGDYSSVSQKFVSRNAIFKTRSYTKIRKYIDSIKK